MVLAEACICGADVHLSSDAAVRFLKDGAIEIRRTVKGKKIETWKTIDRLESYEVDALKRALAGV